MIAKKRKQAQQLIHRYLLSAPNKQSITGKYGEIQAWCVDFPTLLLDPEKANVFAELFWDHYEGRYPFQVVGTETSALLFLSAIAHTGVRKGKPVNVFFFRKERNTTGAQKRIEGFVDGEDVIYVDDVINTGKSLETALALLGSIGRQATEAFCIMDYHPKQTRALQKRCDINISALFSPQDFALSSHAVRQPLAPSGFVAKWYFKSEGANHFFILPKSAPAIDDKRVYFGSDSQTFWALNQSDGSVAWKFVVGRHAGGKSIFSSPVVHEQVVYFGSYDGNVYALHARDGSVKWIYREGDWIGSSPAVATERHILFIGLEFGLFRQKGGIAAIDIKTGKRMWSQVFPDYAHSSPLYIAKHDMVVIGSNDGTVYAHKAKTGELIWKHAVEGEVKESFAYDKGRDLLVFGAFDGNVYAVRAKTGGRVWSKQLEDAIYSTPCIHGNVVYVSCLDKKIYAVDIERAETLWTFFTYGRLYASPRVIYDTVFIGSNDGRLYELDQNDGALLNFFQATERIVNAVAFNERTRRYFLSTAANELYCLEKDPAQ